MPEDQSTRSAPDQNDPTGHTRAGSPTYHPGNPPSNNLRVSAEPVRKSSEDEPEDPPKTGTLQLAPGTEPNVPSPMVQDGAPD
jgi:hypothetical protein